ncbi:hypothetical protein [Tenacibaculum crassostreae]|uniref:hypothetical protein n=1 Tax=Tenacibaculum crassostreae TaxID=502683 RepID=UPI0038957065
MRIFKIYILIPFISVFILFSLLVIYHSLNEIIDKNNELYWVKKEAYFKSEYIEFNKYKITYSYNIKNKTYTKIDSLDYGSEIENYKKLFIWVNPNNVNESKIILKKGAYENLVFGLGFAILPLAFIVGIIISLKKENEIINGIKIIE